MIRRLFILAAVLAGGLRAQQCPQGYTLSGGVCVANNSGGGGGGTPATVQSGAGDGINVIGSLTSVYTYYNDTGKTITVTGIKCHTDNNGSTTVNVANGSAVSFLTGSITCSTSYAAGTQSTTVTLAAGDSFVVTVSADGASKQINWVITLH